MSTDANEQFRILEIALGEEGTASRVRVRVYLLNPGETFERFGGSSRGLTVAAGKRGAERTASLIVSTLQCGSVRDVEYDMRGGKHEVWPWIKRMLLREAGVQLPDEE